MDELNDKYRKLNPFVQNSVGETAIWGSDDNGFCDVESINETAFKTLLTDIRFVDTDAKTRARFLVGAAGSGKSHLFARLRRKLPNGQFTFVCNPSTTVSHIKRFILKKVVSGMTRPAMGPDGPLPYSQLQRMVYSLLQRFLKEKNWNVNQIHERWKRIRRSKCYQNMQKLEKGLATIPELEIPIHERRVLVQILDDEKRDLAASWLSGNQSLTEADYRSLEVAEALGYDEISDLIKQLGYLSIGTGPIVLILDQLDSLEKPDQIHEIESLMIDLNDSSHNWYVIVSLVQEKFDLWYSSLSQPFKGRFGSVTHNSVRLATAELSNLSHEQRLELITARLATRVLRFQREKDGIKDPYYPISETAIRDLTSSDIANARTLIQRAEQAYTRAVTGHTSTARRTLCDFLEQLLADLRAELLEEDLAVDTAYVADRVEELFKILWFARAKSALKGTDGPLYKELPNFEGVDRFYNCGDRPVRVVLYDVQQKNKFPSVLKRIVNAPPDTILIRDGRVAVSGKATKEGLDLFQKDKSFFHMTLEQVKTFHAMGNLLARMREGEFNNEETDPGPTETGIYECLAQNSVLVETDLAQTFLARAGLETQSQGRNSPDDSGTDGDGSDSFGADDSLVAGLTRIMKEERWMSFERLCVRAGSRGINADPQRVNQCLKAKPICQSVLIYPKHANLLESIAIVIWNLEE